MAALLLGDLGEAGQRLAVGARALGDVAEGEDAGPAGDLERRRHGMRPRRSVSTPRARASGAAATPAAQIVGPTGMRSPAT